MSDVRVNKWPNDLLDRAVVGDFLTSYLVNRYVEIDGAVDFSSRISLEAQSRLHLIGGG